MKGAIDTLRGWRGICNKHTYTSNNGGEIRVYSHCCNCKLHELCSTPPRDLTDEDILDLVKLIEEEI